METIFEADAQLRTDPVKTLDLLRRLGVSRVKLYIPWAAVAPDPTAATPPAGFDPTNPQSYPASSWTYYDAVVRDAAARGVGIDLTVGAPAPRWATGPGAPPGAPVGVWKPSAAEYGSFVHALAVRYSGRYTPPGGSAPLPRADFWAIWNEPNLGSANLAPQAIDGSTVETSAAMYRGLVDSAWSALHATGHAGDTILVGELAPYGQTGGNSPGNYGEMVPLRFVRALYCVGANDEPLRGTAAGQRGCPTSAAASKRFASDHPGLFGATGFAIHPYPSGAVQPNVVLPNGPDFVNLASLARLETLLDNVAGLYGSSTRLPFYNTEYGYFTNPPFGAGASLDQAAADINWAEYLSWLNPRVRSYDQYQLTDPPAGGHSKFDTGLEFADGGPKPTLAAFRLPVYLPVTHASSDTPLMVWGAVRPARYVSAPGSVRIELQPNGAKTFELVQAVSVPDRDGYFLAHVRFSSSGAVRLSWTYPDGTTIHSREVPISIN